MVRKEARGTFGSTRYRRTYNSGSERSPRKGTEMKIAVSAVEPNLESEVYPRFGRSRYFVIVDPETMHFEGLTNPNVDASGGAGISTAQLVFKKGASVIITGTIGPKAHQVLATAGVRVFTGVSGTIREAIASFKAGKLLEKANAKADAGIEGGTGMGRGMGGGGGRGMGRGRRCGGGKNMGMGAGRGGGVGRFAPRGWDTEPWSPEMNQANDPDELASLKQEASKLADELTRIIQRIEQIEKR